MIRHPLATLVALSLSVATLSVVAWLPTYLAPEESLTELLPTYVGVVGYRFEAHTATDSDTQEVVVDLGPSESAPSGPSARRSARPYLALPWLDSTDPAMQLTSRCSTAAGGSEPTCTLRIVPKIDTQLPTAAVWRLSTEPVTTTSNATTAQGNPVPAGQSRTLQTWPSHFLKAGDTLTLTPRLPRGVGDARSLTVTEGDDGWRLGGCTLPAGERGTDSRVALLDLFHTASKAGVDASSGETCSRTPITDEDRLQQRWLAPTGKGGYALPMRSFVQTDGPNPLLVLLRDEGFPQLEVNGKPPRAAPLETTLRPGQRVTLNIARRRFQTRRESDEHAQACAQSWQPACTRLQVYLVRHALHLQVRKDGSVEVLLDQNSAALRSYSHIALQPEDLLSNDRPVRFIYAHGSGAAARLTSSPDQPGVRALAFPFTVRGGLSYTATLRLKREDGGITIRYRDASKSNLWQEPGRFEGGSQYHPLFEVDIAQQPQPFVRSLALPYLVLSMVLVLCLVIFGARPGVWRLVVFGNALLLLLATASVIHGLLGYAVFTQNPWDWEAFDQLILSGLALPAALIVGTGIGLSVHIATRGAAGPALPPRRIRVWAIAALMGVVLLQTTRLAMAGRESLGPIRVAALLPILIGAHALWFSRARRVVHDAWPTGWRISWQALLSPVGSTALLGLGVAAWWADKGAMLLFLVPTATMAALHHLQLFRDDGHYAARPTGSTSPTQTTGAAARRWFHAVGAVLLVIGIAASLHFTRVGMSTLFRMDLPEVRVAPNAFCASGATTEAEMAESCVDTITARSQRSALATMDAGGLFATNFNRRHKIRFLDWINDGTPEGRCQAAARLPTQAGVEVAFFRAISRAYLTTPSGDRSYLQPSLVAFDSGTRNSLLDDYLAVVQAATQFPPTMLSLLCVIAALIVMIGLLLSRPNRRVEGSLLLVVGVSTLLLAALCMTVAANYDVWPNFAQSTPLIAIRSHSAWLLDALTLGLLAAGFVVRNLDDTEENA